MKHRYMLLGAVRELRDTLKARRFKRMADDADLLLQDILDAGLDWNRMIPRARNLISVAQMRMNGRDLLR